MVHATVHQVLNVVKSTEDKDTFRNNLQEDMIQNTEMKQRDRTCNAFEMTEVKTLNKNETVLKSGTKVAVPGTSENVIQNVTEEAVQGKSENDDMLNMTEAKTVKETHTAIESVMDNIALESVTKVAAPGTLENVIEKVTEEAVQGKSENDDMSNMTEAKTVNETDTPIESVRENIVPGRSENEGISKITGDKTVMENIELRTEVNITESRE